MQTCNPSILEAEEGGLLNVSGHPGLHSEFTASLDYMVRFCLKNRVLDVKRKEKKSLWFSEITSKQNEKRSSVTRNP